MRKPKISVVIGTYNRAHYLKDAIDSVLAQSFRDFELIVVDDGSTDRTPELIRSYGDQIIFIRQKNSGASSSRNAGIRAAGGEWIAFLDSDDTWEPEKLKIQIDDLNSYPGAVAHIVDAFIWDSTGTKFSLFEREKLQIGFIEQPLRERPLCDVLRGRFLTPCLMLKKETIAKVGYFDETLKIYEDFDLLTRIALEGPFVVNCYEGTNVRRIGGETSNLGSLARREPVRSLENQVNTFRRLKSDPRLNALELQRVNRLRGDALREIAVQYRKQKEWTFAFQALRRSLIEEPGIASVGRGLFAFSGAKGLTRRVREAIQWIDVV